MSMNENTIDYLLGHHVRAEMILYIPGLHAGAEDNDFPEKFEDFCEDLPDTETADLYVSLPELKPFALEPGSVQQEEVADALYLARRRGFLVKAATPSRLRTRTGHTHLSWGYVRWEWLWVETEEDLDAALIAFSKKVEAEASALPSVEGVEVDPSGSKHEA